ncbi:Tn3 family transposase [Photobacterium frigidiphilum]
MIVYWNALYIEEAVRQLRIEGFEVNDVDIAKVFPFAFKHINMNGKYVFLVPKEVKEGKLRPLRKLVEEDDNSLS